MAMILMVAIVGHDVASHPNVCPCVCVCVLIGYPDDEHVS